MSVLSGAGALLRLLLRRDRVRLPLWILGIVGLVLSNAASFPEVFPTAADRQARAALMSTPATIALTGPGHGLEDYTYGAMVANEGLSFASVLVALMSIFLVTRHLRGEEESGRAELVRAGPVGRHAALAATLAAALLANLAIAALLVLALPASPSQLPVGGSVLFAVSLVSVGLVFAGVAALTSQVAELARGANALAGAALGAAFVLRAIGDMRDGTLSWLSPIGWAQATRSFVDHRWWPLGLSLALLVICVAAAAALNARRDVGAGLIGAKAGPREAAPGLAGPLALALRLQRTAVIGWLLALVLLALVYGSVINEVERFAVDNEAVRQLLQLSGDERFVEGFLSMILQIIALLAAAFAVQSTLRLRSEETAGRLEPLLAGPVARTRWASSHIAVAAAGSALLLLAAGLTMGSAAAVAQDDAAWIGRLVAAALVHLPAVWLAMAAAVALFGLLPRLAAAAWALVIYGMVVLVIGPVLQVPDWLLEVSPFAHVPALPAEELDVVPLVVLLGVAAALLAAGLAGFRRRDVAGA